MRVVVPVAVLLCAAAVGLCAPPPADSDAARYDEELLRQAGLTVSAEALAAFFAERSPPDADLAKVDELVRQLGSDQFAERQKASSQLTALGPAAAPALLRVMSAKENEVVTLATECFRKVEARCDPGVCIPAARGLARLAPDKAPAALLRRLPFAWPDEREAIWFALSDLAGKGGRLAPAYAKGLNDPAPARRAQAGFLLARWGTDRERKAAAALLKDADAEVRLRIAQGLLGAGSTEGVPALIALLAHPTKPVAWQAEELLRWWAGADGPRPGGDWEAWWKGKPTVRQTKRAYRPRLLLVGDGTRTRMRAWLCGSDGRARWELTWESKSTDRKAPVGEAVSGFVLLPEFAEVVAAEWSPTALKDRPPNSPLRQDSGWIVTGRDFQGRVRWKAARSGWPVHIQRLSSGTVWTSCGEITPEGAEVPLSGLWKALARRNMPGHGRVELAWPYRVAGRRWVFRAFLPPGRYLLLEQDEKDGKEREVPGTFSSRPRVTVAPLGNGHCLVADTLGKEAREVDARGRVLWQFRSADYVEAAIRLPGGNTVVLSRDREVKGVLLEVDQGGEVVWQARAGINPRSVAVCFPLLVLGF